MRRETFVGFHEALRLGVGHCPSDLFVGSVPAIVRGLKVHANNISHARHVALEETYPRLVEAMGLESFHAAAGRFLNQPEILGRSLDSLGEGFGKLLDDPAQRDLALAEWLWLEAFQSPEADAFSLAELAVLDPDSLLDATLRLHPATRWFDLELANRFEWDSPLGGDGDAVLFSRPDAQVLVRRLDSEAASILPLLANSFSVDQLLESDPPALIALIDAGSVILENHHER